MQNIAQNDINLYFFEKIFGTYIRKSYLCNGKEKVL